MKSSCGYIVERIDKTKLKIITPAAPRMSGIAIKEPDGYYNKKGRRINNDRWLNSIEEFLIFERKQKLEKLLT